MPCIPNDSQRRASELFGHARFDGTLSLCTVYENTLISLKMIIVTLQASYLSFYLIYGVENHQDAMTDRRSI